MVATMHDLAAVEHPHLHSRRSVAHQRARLAALGRAEIIISVSHATAAALTRHGVDEHRIVVSQQGPTELPPPERHGVRSPFLLAVGELSIRKGHSQLLRAFASASAAPLHLVLAGPDAGEGRRLGELAARLGIADRLLMVGRVTDAVLAGLYRDALALCFPSLAEGFGLPVLEAMAAGLPVVASDLEVTREVAGDAALLVSPGDDLALSEAIKRVSDDEKLRWHMREVGLARARTFSWEATADATMAAYRRALACV
jgi:glycosyltransferase involved in cell wall biosynthesis